MEGGGAARTKVLAPGEAHNWRTAHQSHPNYTEAHTSPWQKLTLVQPSPLPRGLLTLWFSTQISLFIVPERKLALTALGCMLSPRAATSSRFFSSLEGSFHPSSPALLPSHTPSQEASAIFASGYALAKLWLRLWMGAFPP